MRYLVSETPMLHDNENNMTEALLVKKGKYYYIAHDPAIMYTSFSKYQKQIDKHALNRYSIELN